MMECPDCGAMIPDDSETCPECGAVIDNEGPGDRAHRGETEIRREVPFEMRAADGGDGLTLTGYAAVFNSPTTIRDHLGEFTESIAPGAFKRTLNAQKPVMQFDHGQHPLIGSLPIASIRKLKEDARGLYVEARVFDNWLTEPLRDAIREQAIRGMSFRFSVVSDTWDDSGDMPSRMLNEVKLFELGPVVHPAYADTTVALRSLARVVPGIVIGTPTAPADNGTAQGLASTADPAAGHSAQRALYPSVLRTRIEALRLARS